MKSGISDNATLVGQKPVEPLSWGGRLVVAGFLLFAPYYLYWRLGTFNPDALFFSWLLWGAEAFGFLTAMLHIFMVLRLTKPLPLVPPPGLTVDVFIPTYNESVELVRHTLAAACRMDYPHTTWLLDDGKRPEMEALARQYGCRYLARNDNTHAKAGNLNHALGYATGEFIAVFDADHVPGRSFLEKTLGFFADPRLAFVQTPQDFYNLDSFQHRKHKRLNVIWTEQSLFFRVIQRGKDYWNAAFFCGSCAVIRRAALDKIGGFATGTVTEDLHTSIRLHKQGYQSVYYPESLAFGVAPETLRQFLVQRRRWGQGAMQVWREEGFLFARGLTLAQRLNYFASVSTYFDGWQKLIFYSAPIFVLFTGILPINVLGQDYLLHFVPYYLLCFWAYEETGRGYGRTVFTEEYNMARFATFAAATLGWFGGSRRFRVTDKSYDLADDRRHLLPQLLVLYGNLLAIVGGVALWGLFQHLTPLALGANILWAGINLGLAGFVSRFSLYRRHRRHEYRFTLPLTARVFDAAGHALHGVVSNISFHGMSFVCAGDWQPGQELHGEIILPAYRIQLRATVCHRASWLAHHPASKERHGENAWPVGELREYGMRLQWQTERDEEEMEKFLFGSDAQWRMLEWHEQSTTPIVRARHLLARLASGRTEDGLFSHDWLPVTYFAGEEKVGVLFPGEDAQTARLLTVEPISSVEDFHCRSLDAGQEGMDGSLRNLHPLVTDCGTFHVADFQRRSRLAAAGCPAKVVNR